MRKKDGVWYRAETLIFVERRKGDKIPLIATAINILANIHLYIYVYSNYMYNRIILYPYIIYSYFL